MSDKAMTKLLTEERRRVGGSKKAEGRPSSREQLQRIGAGGSISRPAAGGWVQLRRQMKRSSTLATASPHAQVLHTY